MALGCCGLEKTCSHFSLAPRPCCVTRVTSAGRSLSRLCFCTTCWSPVDRRPTFISFPRRGQRACVPATPSPPSAALLRGDFAHVVSGVILDFASLPVLLCHPDQLFLPPMSELWGLGPPALAAPLPSPVACHHHLHWRLSRRCSRPSSPIPHVPRFLLCALQSAREQRLHISLGHTHALTVLSAFPHPLWPRPARFPASALAPAQWPERPFIK